MSELLEPQVGYLPHATPGRLTRTFWDACADGRLTFQRCDACRMIAFPPVEVCRACLSTELRWENSSGRGRLYSWTVVHRPVTPDFVTPYVPAIIDLDEGYQMMSNLIGIRVDQISVDLPVQVTFERLLDDLVLPYFVPARASDLTYPREGT